MNIRIRRWVAFSICCLLSIGTASAQVRNLKVEQTLPTTPVASGEPGLALVSTTRPPPPTITDLVLLLQSYKPDLERIRNLVREMNAAVPVTSDPELLSIAWHKKALAAEELQEPEQRVLFLEKAIAHARQSNRAATGEQAAIGGLYRLRTEYGLAVAQTKGVATSLDSFLELAGDIEQGGVPIPGLLLTTYTHISKNYVDLGDLESGRRILVKLDALFKRLGARPEVAVFMSMWAELVESSRGVLMLSEGRLAEADLAFAAAIRQAEDAIRNNYLLQAKFGRSVPVERLQMHNDSNRIFLAQTYAQQGRLDEAELLLREVLKRSLMRDGRNSFVVGRALFSLSQVFTNRGRFSEALVLAQWGAQTLQEGGVSENSTARIKANITLANALVAVERPAEAVVLIDTIRNRLADDVRLEEGFGHGSLLSIRAFILTQRFNDALRDGDNLLKYNTRYLGADHYSTAEARAYRAMVLHRTGQSAEARKEFERAIAVLEDPAKIVGKQQASVARTSRLRLILNEYLDVLVGKHGIPTEQSIAEAFRVSDVARWQSVQKAVAGSALRAAAGTPELGAQIRKVQDADDELQAVYKNLISQRSAPPDKQLPVVIAAMEARIAALQKDQQRDLVEIRRKFPQYDALVNPRPADFATARKVLQPTEALLSVYVTPVGSYVWATGPDGTLRFHFSAQKPAWVADKVKRLRDSVDLTTGIAPDRMRFDLEAGSALYQELLAPVAGAWDKADTLLVVANDSLGQIPFSLLPTSAAPLGKAEGGLALSQFRTVPWLARKVAVAYLPSVSALVTLRALPVAQSQRAPFIGFGDPDFGPQATDAGVTSGKVSRGTRNLSIQHAAKWDESKVGTNAVPVALPVGNESPALMQLPDTRDEITAIATALSANLKNDTFFGSQANRKNVLDADLKHRRVVAFATHGLVAGDIPGLDQPALALSPGTGNSIADGLLKLEDILKLSMDPDLVVLSACNTAAADGAGVEAVSGLVRGFFYAGARSVLATHWPVETVSARQLVTHLFERYSQDSTLTRAQALRRAMVEIIDTQVAVDSRGKPVNAYAHPAFWAPYALYGDPGR
jgi:CHAT domain-containing protein